MYYLKHWCIRKWYQSVMLGIDILKLISVFIIGFVIMMLVKANTVVGYIFIVFSALTQMYVFQLINKLKVPVEKELYYLNWVMNIKR